MTQSFTLFSLARHAGITRANGIGGSVFGREWTSISRLCAGAAASVNPLSTVYIYIHIHNPLFCPSKLNHAFFSLRKKSPRPPHPISLFQRLFLPCHFAYIRITPPLQGIKKSKKIVRNTRKFPNGIENCIKI